MTNTQEPSSAISTLSEVVPFDTTSDAKLQLSPITLDEAYRKKWNIITDDFMCLTQNERLVSKALYRLGGVASKKDLEDDYFQLIKYQEAFYPDNITKDHKSKPHLSGHFCILNKQGVVKVDCGEYNYPYVVKNSVIYTVKGKVYNIETGEFYADSSTTMDSNDFYFVENRYDKEKSKRGVLKINKKDGSYELFPSE